METVVPRGNRTVLIVRGSERGRTGHLLERSDNSETAVVQLVDSMEILTLKFDDICESTECSQ